MERIMKKNKCSTNLCITLVLRDVSISILLLFISNADLLVSRTEKVRRKMSLAQLYATHVPHITWGSSCHGSVPTAMSLWWKQEEVEYFCIHTSRILSNSSCLWGKTTGFKWAMGKEYLNRVWMFIKYYKQIKEDPWGLVPRKHGCHSQTCNVTFKVSILHVF